MGMEIELEKKGYIDRAVLMRDLLRERFRFFGEVDYLQIIRDQPSADVIPVVRCGLPEDCHCIHYENGYCKLLELHMDPCDFCSYGKELHDAKT